MRTYTLDIDYDEEFGFELIGLRCSEKDYRLAWSLNLTLGWLLERKRDVVIAGEGVDLLFNRFDYEHADDQTMVSLVQNRTENGWMLPEWTQFDFLLKIDNDQWGIDDDFYRKLRLAPFVMAAFPLVLDKLKSKHNLIFWEYASTDKSRNEENKNGGYHRPGFGF